MSYYLNKTIEYGLYLLVFFLPLQTRWIIRPEASECLTISLYGTDLLLTALIVLFVVFNFQFSIFNFQTIFNFQFFKQSASGGKFLILIFITGLALTAFVSVFSAPDKLITVQSCSRLLAGIGLFWLVTSAAYDKLKLIGWFLAGIFLQAGLAIWQFLSQSAFACKWLGLAAHSASDLGTSVVEIASGGRWLRAYGGLDHPNVLGGLLVIGLLIAVELIIKNIIASSQDTRYKQQGYKQIQNHHRLGGIPPSINIIKWRDKLKISNSLIIDYLNLEFVWNLYLVSCAVVFAFALFFTFSRAAWVGLAVGVLTLAAGLFIQKNYHSLKKLLKLMLVGGVLVVVLSLFFDDLVFTRVAADSRLETKSTNERVESLKKSWEIIKDNWLFGVGIGNYTLGIRNQESGIRGDIPAWYYQPVHNVLLLIWAEIGIFGLLFFILIPLFIIHNSLFKYNSRSKNLILNISLLAAIITMFLVDHWWWSLHFGVLLFWLILGLIFAVDRNNNKAYNNSIIYFNK